MNLLLFIWIKAGRLFVILVEHTVITTYEALKALESIENNFSNNEGSIHKHHLNVLGTN